MPPPITWPREENERGRTRWNTAIRGLRPILMQLDLQSVEKAPFSTFAWAFAPKMLEIGLPRLRMSWSFLQDLSKAVSRFSRGPVAGNHRHFFSIRSGIVIVFDPNGSKKCWRWFPATPSLEKREAALDRSWRKLRLILRQVRPISNIFGAKAHANVLKGIFWTDCKSNCIRIGLRYLSKKSGEKNGNERCKTKKKMAQSEMFSPRRSTTRSRNIVNIFIQYWYTNGPYISGKGGTAVQQCPHLTS